MAKTESEFLTPIGRLVGGSLYEGQTKDLDGNILTGKDNQPRVHFYFAIAIEKKGEQHWNQTEWGAKIWNVGNASFPNGQANSPAFAWKIIDGDSAIPNSKGSKPCDRIGHAGHWILNMGGGFAPVTCSRNADKILEKDFIKLGYYIQVAGVAASNESDIKPGIYLNYRAVSFQAYGPEINLGIDVKKLGFGQQQLPAGASLTPLASNSLATVAEVQPTVATVAPAPYPPILNPAPTVVVPVAAVTPLVPAPPVTHKILTPAAGAASYDDYIKAGWTDELLIAKGFLAA